MMVSCVEQINTNHNGNKKIGKNGKIKVKHNYHSYSVRYFLTNFTQYRQIYWAGTCLIWKLYKCTPVHLSF